MRQIDIIMLVLENSRAEAGFEITIFKQRDYSGGRAFGWLHAEP
jgi:hypothetical protein